MTLILRAVIVSLAILAAACTTPTPPVSFTVPIPTVTASSCHYQADGALPDPVCTPGATDPNVTQSNLASTICHPGYTRTVRPPVSYTTPVKRSSLIAYGQDPDQASHYELDHLVPLELGGAPRDPANLWPEPEATYHAKDAIENELHAAVCSGQLSLSDAQQRMRTDWRGPVT